MWSTFRRRLDGFRKFCTVTDQSNLFMKGPEGTDLNWKRGWEQRRVWKWTYREDGNKYANTTKHGIANGVSLFSGVADGLVRTVKPALVRLYGASLNDQERQASYKRHKKGEKTARGEGEKQESTQSVTQIYIYIKNQTKKNRTGQGALWH